VLTDPDRCVGAPGGRKLLRFDTLVVNTGTADLVVGPPSASDPRFEASPCHGGRLQLASFTAYALHPRGAPAVVASGHKESFCLEDSTPFGSTAPARYTCTNQGISAGWGDLYGHDLDCQWVDVTDVPPGEYDLAVTVDPDGVLAESNPANN